MQISFAKIVKYSSSEINIKHVFMSEVRLRMQLVCGFMNYLITVIRHILVKQLEIGFMHGRQGFSFHI